RLVFGNVVRTGSGRLLLANRVDHAGDLRRRFREDADQHGGGLDHDAEQHRQRLVTGRQRRQDIHVGARVHLSAQRYQPRLQLVVRLGELLDQASRGAGVFLREGIQQRTGQLILDDGVIGVFHCTRDQRVLCNLQEHARLAGLLAHVGQLTDGETRVLRGDQRMRLGGDFGQFGNDFLLLGQIESHCIPLLDPSPASLRRITATPARLQPVWSSEASSPSMPGSLAVPLRWPFPDPVERSRRDPGGSAPSTQALPRRAGLSDPACSDGDSLPVRASMPVVVARRPRLRSLTAIAGLRWRCPQNWFAYLSARVDWSTMMPGPMVELSATFCRYWPLAVAGLAFTRSASSACRLVFSDSASKSALPIVQWMMPALSVR